MVSLERTGQLSVENKYFSFFILGMKKKTPRYKGKMPTAYVRDSRRKKGTQIIHSLDLWNMSDSSTCWHFPFLSSDKHTWHVCLCRLLGFVGNITWLLKIREIKGKTKINNDNGFRKKKQKNENGELKQGTQQWRRMDGRTSNWLGQTATVVRQQQWLFVNDCCELLVLLFS